MSHHVPGPPDYDVVMTEQVPGPKEPKLLGRHMPSIPNCAGTNKLDNAAEATQQSGGGQGGAEED